MTSQNSPKPITFNDKNDPFGESEEEFPDMVWETSADKESNAGHNWEIESSICEKCLETGCLVHLAGKSKLLEKYKRDTLMNTLYSMRNTANTRYTCEHSKILMNVWNCKRCGHFVCIPPTSSFEDEGIVNECDEVIVEDIQSILYIEIHDNR